MKWNKEFEKTMNHTYLVLSKESFFEEKSKKDYRLNMLLQNKIPGLLSANQQSLNGENKIYYEISGLEAIEDLFSNKEMDYKTVKELIAGCVNIFSNIEEYMLDGQQIILSPEYIYIDNETRRPQFVFYPDYTKDSRESFVELIEYVLEKLDHTDEATVMLGYNIYRATRSTNFTMQDIENVLVEKRELTAEEIIIDELTVPDSENSESFFGKTEVLIQERTEEKVKKLKSLNFSKKNFKQYLSFTQPAEITGMIASGLTLGLLCGFLIYSLNKELFYVTDTITLYLVGGMAMCFMTIVMLYYTYLKKRKTV